MKVTHVALRPTEASLANTPNYEASHVSEIEDDSQIVLRKYYIYKLVDPNTASVRYIGITSGPLKNRLYKHMAMARHDDPRHISNWIRKILREGKRPLIVELEETVDPQREAVWISYFRNLGCDLTNASDGCEGQTGSHRTSETKTKISNAGMRRFKDISGQKFGRLTAKMVVSHKPVKWRCQCDCGKETIVPSIALIFGNTRSCGCLSRELAAERTRGRVQHGMWKSSEYHTWIEMIAKCHNITHGRYPKHGAKGIIVCDRWRESFTNFYDDMGPRPANYVLGKRDRNGNFTPENCYWETCAQKQKAIFNKDRTGMDKTDL